MPLLSQWTTFDDSTTVYDDQNNITTMNTNTTENFDTNDITTTNAITRENLETDYVLSIQLNNDENDAGVGILTKCIWTFFAIVFVIIISVIVFRRYSQHSRKEKKKKEECLQNNRVYAHPFEEIVVAVDDEPHSIELLSIREISPTK